MPQQHTITDPDGVEYKVTLPPGATKQDALERIQAHYGRAQDMTEADIAIARTKDDDFGAFLRKRAESIKVEGETPQQRGQRLYGRITDDWETGTSMGMLRGGFQGLTYGGGDEVVAAAAAALNRATGRDKGRSFGELYNAYLGAERGKLKQFRKDRPSLAIGSEIAGALPTALLAPGGPQALTLGGRMLSGGLQGAAHGGVYGFGAGEGGLGGRLSSAQDIALAGGGLGAAAPAVGAGARNLYGATLGRGRAARQMGMSRPAFDMLTRTLDADDLGRAAAVARRGGPETMAADLSPNAQALLDTAIQRSGAAGRNARRLIDDRVARSSTRLTDTFDRLMGRATGPRAAARDIAQRTSAGRQTAYDRAYSQAIDYSSDAGRAIEATLDRIPPRIGQSAIQRANEKMTMEGVDRARQIVASVADDGSITFVEQPNVMQLDYIKRALGDLAEGTRDVFGRRSGEGNDLMGLATSLRDAMRTAVPEYGVALRRGADKLQMDQALKLGRDLLNARTTREAVDEMVNELQLRAPASTYAAPRLSTANRGELLRGLRSYIDDATANVRRTISDPNIDAREAMKAINDMSSRAAREKLDAVLGRTVANRLFRQLDSTAQALNLRVAVAQNSKTFVRSAADETMREFTEAGIANKLRSGQLIRGGEETVGAVMGRSQVDKQRLLDNAYSDLVEFLTGPRGADAVRSAEQLLTAQQRVLPREEQIRLIAEAIMARNVGATGPLMNTE